MKTKYDIFISYRRDGGAQYARILQMMLQQRGYTVFLDYDELKDGVFSEKIEQAIAQAPIFIFIMSEGALNRCVNEGDWVRREIEMALKLKKHIIPVNPDGKYRGEPDNLPEDIKHMATALQHSEISFGQTLGITVDFMISQRIVPTVGERTPMGHLENDPEAIKKILRDYDAKLRQQRHTRRKVAWAVGCLLLVAGCVLGVWKYMDWQTERERTALMQDEIIEGVGMNWSDAITTPQLRAVHSLLDSMVLVQGGTFTMGPQPQADGSYSDDVDVELETPAIAQSVGNFYMGKVEVSRGEWAAIMGLKCPDDSLNLPQTNVSLTECLAFCQKLFDLTGLELRLPTEAEWEYAARGGREPDNTPYAGRDVPDEVAWYGRNSGGKAHLRDHASDGMYCNALNLYDMSGNVSEWCATPFRRYVDLATKNPNPEIIDPNAYVTRGGDFMSEAYEITVTHRNPMNKDDKAPTVGLRLVLVP